MPRLNVQAYVRSYLDGALDGVTVAVRIPDPRPERLVVVQRSGGSKLDRLRDRPGVHLLIYGGSEWDTSELAGEVSDLMDDLNRSDDAFTDGIDLVTEESMRSDEDTETEPPTPRWFGSYTLITNRY